jgi:hypothetical protein
MDGADGLVVTGSQIRPHFSRIPSMIKKQKSLSYAELSRTSRHELERLAEAGLLDHSTLARCAHLARFFERIRQMGPAESKICDVLTEDELQKIWRETANEEASPHTTGRRHLIH